MILRISLMTLLLTGSAYAQSGLLSAPPVAAAILTSTASSQLVGKWTYRSFVNSPDLIGDDAQKALNLNFGEGVVSFALAGAALTGTFDMGDAYVLDLKGVVHPASGHAPLTIEMSGVGRAGTPTAGWEYDYHGYLGYHWPNGVNQAAVLVGTVVRAKAHDGGAAGLVASFMAVKQGQK